MALLENGAVGVNDRDDLGRTPALLACRFCTVDVVLQMIRHGALLTADDLFIFRNRTAVTEEQARTAEAAYKREDNWRRRAPYVMFLSSIRDLVDVDVEHEHEYAPSAPIHRFTPLCTPDNGLCGEMGSESVEAKHVKLLRSLDKVFCRTDTQRLIGSFL